MRLLDERCLANITLHPGKSTSLDRSVNLVTFPDAPAVRICVSILTEKIV